MSKTTTTNSLEETIAFAKNYAPKLMGGEILCLEGDLGAGKTSFVKGLAQGLGITKTITSPTFTLLNVYHLPTPINGIKTLVHIDTYRLKSFEELVGIGATDYLGRLDTLSVVEWPAPVTELLTNKTTVTLVLGHGVNNTRTITEK